MTSNASTERSSEIPALGKGLFADVCGRLSWGAEISQAVGVKYLLNGRR